MGAILYREEMVAIEKWMFENIRGKSAF